MANAISGTGGSRGHVPEKKVDPTPPPPPPPPPPPSSPQPSRPASPEPTMEKSQQQNAAGGERTKSSVQEKVAESSKLQNVAIVTESTEGIGFKIAERLGVDGAQIVVSACSWNQEKINEAVKKLGGQSIEAKWIQCDITKEEERKNLIAKTLQEYGDIDVIVFNTIVPGMPKDIDLQSSAAFIKEAKAEVPQGFSFLLVTEAKHDKSEELALKMKSLANDMFEQNVRVNCVALRPMPMSVDKIQEGGMVPIEERMATAAAQLASNEVSGVTLMAAEEDIPSKEDHRFAGKVAAVTELTEGIGLSIAVQLGIEGASIVVSSGPNQGNISEAVVRLKAKNISVMVVPCDISKDDGRKNLIDKILQERGRLDVIIFNSAAPGMPMDINLQPSALLKEAYDRLQFGSSMVFVSTARPNKPKEYMAIFNHIKSLAIEMAPKGIRVNAVASVSERDIPADKIGEEEKAKTARKSVAAATWLASDASADIKRTGVTLTVAEDIPSKL